MKLVYCPACQDLFKMPVSKTHKKCMCGASGGRYMANGKNAVICGKAIPIGIDNREFMQAIKKRNKRTTASHNDFIHFMVSHPFKAFVIPLICATVKDGKE
jgi:hypothetical protein